MADDHSGYDHSVEKLGCPVCGATVTLSTTYRHTDSGGRSLVDFGCDMEGKCGISLWDPCPLYVAYLERKFEKGRT